MSNNVPTARVQCKNFSQKNVGGKLTGPKNFGTLICVLRGGLRYVCIRVCDCILLYVFYVCVRVCVCACVCVCAHVEESVGGWVGG